MTLLLYGGTVVHNGHLFHKPESQHNSFKVLCCRKFSQHNNLKLLCCDSYDNTTVKLLCCENIIFPPTEVECKLFTLLF